MQYAEKPGQADALRVASAVFGIKHPPPIDWVEGDRLVPCPYGTPSPSIIVNVGGAQVCAGGWTFRDLIQVEWTDTMTIGTSPLPHELGHWMLIEQGGNGDGGEDHRLGVGPIWGPGGMVAQAASVISAGL